MQTVHDSFEEDWFTADSNAVAVPTDHPRWLESKGKLSTKRPADRDESTRSLISLLQDPKGFTELGRQLQDLLNSVTFSSLSETSKWLNIPSPVAPELPNTQTDLEWFASEAHNMREYRGRYVAIWNHAVIGSGSSASEAYNSAKRRNPEADPAITFIPENESALF